MKFLKSIDFNAFFKKHSDRSSCEISTTLCLGYDVSNVDASTLLKALKDDTNEIVGNETDGTVSLGKDITYIQTSLKKGVGASQMGKFTKLIRGTYNLGMSNKEASNFLQEERNEIETLIYE